jgi:Acyl-protein synthetase, LuxE
MILDELLSGPQYATAQIKKERLLLPALKELTRHHVENCAAYAQIVALTAPEFEQARSLEDLPYIPASLFKTHTLQSVSADKINSILTSSGTSGQATSRVAIDDVTAKYQARGLAAVMREAIGARRLPMLLIESEETLKDRRNLNARAIGVLGMMTFGQTPVFALDAQMNLKKDVVKDFLSQHGNAPFLMFGFTFMVWHHFRQTILSEGLDCSRGILVHGGGWKKLESAKIGNAAFRAALKTSCGLQTIYNYYGMIEQPGTIFLEGPDGYLYPPAFGDVIIRDPHTWEALPPGREGVVQVVSLIPRSYPGHLILTEDMGEIISIDAGHGGRLGKAVKINGRAPKAEMRGCSNLYMLEEAA